MLVARFLTVAAAAALLPGCAAARTTPVDPPAQITSEYWPQAAPRLYGTAADWINTGGKPLTMQRGKVYLVDFWEYTCVNCIRTLPYLKEWNRRYANLGLVIIGIHTPEFKFAHDTPNVAAAVKRLGITWPVLVDSEYRNWNAYGNQYWPRHYFVDQRGDIIADHSGEGGYGEAETRIQAMIRAIHPGVKLPAVMEPVRGTDKPGALCYPTTAETYAGTRGNSDGVFGNAPDYAVDAVTTYTDRGTHDDGRIYLQGSWLTAQESVRHARISPTQGSDWLAFRYHALECNAVLRAERGKPYRVYVTQDGLPIARQDAGSDVQYDASGKSYVTVDAPRMYSITRNARFGQHELRFTPDTTDFALYSFTFSSCEVR